SCSASGLSPAAKSLSYEATGPNLAGRRSSGGRMPTSANARLVSRTPMKPQERPDASRRCASLHAATRAGSGRWGAYSDERQIDRRQVTGRSYSTAGGKKMHDRVAVKRAAIDNLAR